MARCEVRRERVVAAGVEEQDVGRRLALHRPLHEIKPHHFEIERRRVPQLRIDRDQVNWCPISETVSGVEEHADISADERSGEIADFRSSAALSRSDPVEDLEAVHPQGGGHVTRIVAGVGEPRPRAGMAALPITSATRLPAWAAEPMHRHKRTTAARNIVLIRRIPCRPLIPVSRVHVRVRLPALCHNVAHFGPGRNRERKAPRLHSLLQSGLVSRFRSSHHCAAPSFANFGIKGTLANLLIWCGFWFRSPHFDSLRVMWTSEPPHRA